MKNETRIELKDSLLDIVEKMSEGNIGAINVIMMLLKTSKKIEPDSIMEGLGPILILDTLNIYGSKIWLLYKDVCEQDIIKVLACLRANELGIISTAQISMMIDTEGRGDKKVLENIVKDVQERLPNFARSETADGAIVGTDQSH